MTKRLRILHCLRAPVGGLFRHVLDLAPAQAARGHQIGLIVDKHAVDALTEGRLAAVAPAMNLGILRLPMSRMPHPSDVSTYRSVVAEAHRLQTDILHGHGAKGGAFARLAARSLKASGRDTTAFYTPHGGSLHYRPNSFEGCVFLGIERILDGLTDGLIFESAFAADIYSRRVGHTATPRRIIPNGLRPSDFIQHVPRPNAADVLFIGELRAIKGVDVLLHALAILNATRPTTAVIVGSGPEGDTFRRLAHDLGLSDRVQFPGAMPAAAAFPLGRAIVVPSRAESLPYIVLEAAAAGIPLIATDVGGIPEIVAGTDTALLPSDDCEALAMAIREAMTDPPSAAARAERLKAAVSGRFTVTGMTDAILDFYAMRSCAEQNHHDVATLRFA